MKYPFEEGVVVAAIKEIIEGDFPYDPKAKGCKPGWRHARLGDLGTVVGVDDPSQSGKDIPTVDFWITRTTTIVFEDEVMYVAASKQEQEERSRDDH